MSRSSWPVPAVGLLLVGALAACSGDGGTSAPSSSGASSGGSSSGTGSSTASTAPPGSFDCEAVAAAQQTLADGGDAELERLGIDRGAPEAFGVVVLATSAGAAEYWAAVDEAVTGSAPPELRADIEVVAAYWAALDPELDAIAPPDASAASLQAAEAELTRLAQSSPDAALATSQQRVQDELADACGTEPSPSSSS